VNYDGSQEAIIFCCVVVIGLLCGGAVGGCIQGAAVGNKYESEAVQHGAAEWTVDENGKRVFRWKERGGKP